MPMEKKVSVIIPCYNAEKYIDRCVESLTAQTIGVESLELIFVDDASTDSTFSRLAVWEQKYPDAILVIACEKNGRQGRARNIGMEYATAPWLFFLDADDWIEEEALEEMYRIAAETGVDTVIGQMGRDAGNGFIPDELRFIGSCHKKVVLTTEERRSFLECGMAPVCGRLYRTDFLREHGLCFLEGTAYEDNYFGALVTAVLTSYYALPKKYYHYYANPSSTVTSRNSAKHLERLQVELVTLEALCELGLDREYHDAVYGRFLKLYYLNTLHLLFMRFDVLPYDVLYAMRREVLERFPDYKESEAYQHLTDLEKGFLLTLEVEMTDELWDNLAQNYRQIVRHHAAQS